MLRVSTYQVKHCYLGSLGDPGGELLLVVGLPDLEDGRVPVFETLDAVSGFGDPTLPRRNRARPRDLRIRVGTELRLLSTRGGSRGWAENESTLG